MMYTILTYYLVAINVVAIIVTMYDKFAAKYLTRYRTRENTLLLIGALGGAISMFVTMQLIRHKTLHKRFMLGLPLMVVIQVGLAYYIYNMV